jgi:hypothetical protein
MTTSRQFSESEGEFTKHGESTIPCRECGGGSVTYKVWESNDGAYEDEKYTCPDCGATWWVDGIDA